MNFRDMAKYEKQDFLLPIIIKALQNLGGKATKQELKEEIRISAADQIPEDVIDEVRISKNGSEWKPFDMTFSFALTNLKFSDFVSSPKRGEIALTEKGIMCDTTKAAEIIRDVAILSAPVWEKRIEENQRLKSLKEQETNSSEEEYEEAQRAIAAVNADENEQLEKSENVEDDWKIELKIALENMQPKKFETFCRALVKAMGVTMDEKIGVSQTQDEGLDGYGYIVDNDFRTTRVAIQAKRWKETKIGSPEIDKFRGAMDKVHAEFGIFITTAKFSTHAEEAARKGSRAITLIDGEQLIKLVEKYQVYIKPTYKLDPSLF